MSMLLGLLMGFLSLLLILLVLVQRGRGGGLAGALGGPGGQSAFGSKAGDTFTVITIVMAAVWGFTCAFSMWLLGQHTAPITDEDTTDNYSLESLDDETPTAPGISISPESGLGSGAAGMSSGASLSGDDDESKSTDLVPAKKEAAPEASSDEDTSAKESETKDAEKMDASKTEDKPAADEADADEKPVAKEDKPAADEADAGDKSEAKEEAK